MRYKVKITFKYGDKRLCPGDIWEPEGGKWDQSIKQHFVYPVEDEPAPKKKVTKRGRSSNE